MITLILSLRYQVFSGQLIWSPYLPGYLGAIDDERGQGTADDVITIQTAQELVDAPVTQEKIWQAMQTVA
jgi:hypothetical protein